MSSIYNPFVSNDQAQQAYQGNKGSASTPEKIVTKVQGGGGYSPECDFPLALNFQFAQFNSVAPDLGAVRHISVSDPCPDGFYRRILALDAQDTDNNLQYLDFVLIPPGTIPATSVAGGFSATLADALKQLNSSIRILQGHTVSGLSDTTTIASQAGSTAAALDMVPLIVPPRWRLGVFELNGVVSAVAHHLTLRMLYLELPVTLRVPF